MNLSRAAFFLPPPPAITTRSLSTCAGSKARDQSGSDSGRETGLELFSRVFIDRRARIVRARQSGPFARELRKAMQARTTREPLVPSYVLTSISLLRLSPFLSIVPLSLSPSLSLPFSPTPLSSSLALNHTCPPSLSPFLTFTFLSPSHCIDPPPPVSPSLFLRSTLLCPLQACYALFLSFELNDLFSYLFPLFPLISFVYSFPLSLSLIFTLHLIVPAFLVSLLSTVHLSRSLSLSFSLSFYLVSRLTLYLRPAFSLSFIPSLSVRSSQPPPLEFSPFQLPSSPTLSVYTFARFASPAGHPQSSISLSHAHSFSLRLSLSHRFTGVRFAYSLSVSHSLSLSFSLVFRASSIYIFLGRLPSFSLTSASYLGFAETCSRGFRSSPFDPRLLSFNMSRGPFYSSCRRDCRPTTYFVFGNVLARGPGTDRIAY